MRAGLCSSVDLGEVLDSLKGMFLLLCIGPGFPTSESLGGLWSVAAQPFGRQPHLGFK